MHAVVYETEGGPALWHEVPDPISTDTGAVIEVQATGICRSDWHSWRGHDPVRLPHIPGHEFAGVVASVGSAVRDFAVGDRVTAPFVNGCGSCPWCRSGNAQVCPNQSQPGFSDPGSYAELVAVRQADFNLVRLPDQIDFVTAATLGCRFATAFRALTAYHRIEPGHWLIIVGCGGVGLSALMIAKAFGARVIAVDRSESARARAAELGADHVLDGLGSDESIAAVHDLTDGGAQLSLDALGSPATAAAAIRSLRRGGQHVQVGLMLGDAANAPLPWDLVISRELRVAGSHGMAAVDYPAMLDLIVAGRLDPTRLVGEQIPLDQAGVAMMAMDQLVAARSGTTVAVR